MTPKLSPRTLRLLELVFRPSELAEATQWIEEECGHNLPFCDKGDEFELERIRFAVIKLSSGNMQRLLKAVHEARMDWCDVLMAAGFWLPTRRT